MHSQPLPPLLPPDSVLIDCVREAIEADLSTGHVWAGSSGFPAHSDCARLIEAEESPAVEWYRSGRLHRRASCQIAPTSRPPVAVTWTSMARSVLDLALCVVYEQLIVVSIDGIQHSEKCRDKDTMFTPLQFSIRDAYPAAYGGIMVVASESTIPATVPYPGWCFINIDPKLQHQTPVHVELCDADGTPLPQDMVRAMTVIDTFVNSRNANEWFVLARHSTPATSQTITSSLLCVFSVSISSNAPDLSNEKPSLRSLLGPEQRAIARLTRTLPTSSPSSTVGDIGAVWFHELNGSLLLALSTPNRELRIVNCSDPTAAVATMSDVVAAVSLPITRGSGGQLDLLVFSASGQVSIHVGSTITLPVDPITYNQRNWIPVPSQGTPIRMPGKSGIELRMAAKSGRTTRTLQIAFPSLCPSSIVTECLSALSNVLPVNVFGTLFRSLYIQLSHIRHDRQHRQHQFELMCSTVHQLPSSASLAPQQLQSVANVLLVISEELSLRGTHVGESRTLRELSLQFAQPSIPSFTEWLSSFISSSSLLTAQSPHPEYPLPSTLAPKRHQAAQTVLPMISTPSASASTWMIPLVTGFFSAARQSVDALVSFIASNPQFIQQIHKLPPGVATAAQLVVTSLSNKAVHSWPQSVLRVLGRRDILLTLGSAQPPPLPGSRAPTDLGRLIAQSERFRADMRIEDVHNMLQSSRISRLALPDPPPTVDHLLEAEKHSRLLHLAQRTLSAAVGRAMLTMHTECPIATDCVVLEEPIVSGRFPSLPSATAATQVSELDQSTVPPEYFSWPDFHSGVASGLRLLPPSMTSVVDNTWIRFNLPDVPSSLSAGFLLGLGLSGHLKCLTTLDLLNIMSINHEPTAMGFLLGYAATHAGKKDQVATKLIAVHIPAMTLSSSYIDHQNAFSPHIHGNNAGISSVNPDSTSFTAASFDGGMASYDHQQQQQPQPQYPTAVSMSEAANLTRALDQVASAQIQSIAMVSIGLVYLGAKNDRIASVLLDEIQCRNALNSMAQADALINSNLGASGHPSSSSSLSNQLHVDQSRYRLAMHSLSAAFGYGFIMVGAAPTACLQPLGGLITAASRGALSPTAGVTVPGALVAIGLSFLATNSQFALKIVRLPQQLPRLYTMPHDIVLLRSMATCLILWRAIEPSIEWVTAHCLPSLQSDTAGSSQAVTDRAVFASLSSQAKCAAMMAVSGALFVIGIKYTGSSNKQVTALLETHLALFEHYAFTAYSTADPAKRTSFARRQLASVALQALSTTILAASLVHAASGDLALLKRLRLLHGRLSGEVNYGHHMAWHIAKGFLFLSAGNAAPVIDSTKLSNVALLVCSLFPLFPTSPAENRCHLQPLRHLWALTTRRHVLVVRDADDGHSLNEKCQVKIIQHFGDKTRRVQSAALPAVLPELSSRLGFIVECDGYWPVRYPPGTLKEPIIFLHKRSINAESHVDVGKLTLHGDLHLVQQVARCIPLCLKQPQQKRQVTDIDDIELRIAAELSRLSIPVNITH